MGIRGSAFLSILLLAAVCAPVAQTDQATAERAYEATGLVLQTDRMHGTVTLSEDAIPGFMDAMVMSYRLPTLNTVADLQPGTKIGFTLVVGHDSSSIRNIRVLKFDSVARDPVQVRTLDLVESALNARKATDNQIAIGHTVPDFSLIDQQNRRITLSEFRGKLVAITFIYTRCPLPDYCFRLSNNFGQLQQRFEEQLGRELVLLSISFDPIHDQPDILKKYANIWKAGAGWHFLTGPLDQVKQVCAEFGMNFWPDEGLLTHSLHTVLIDQKGDLSANIEGNQFTAKQLGDLVETLLANAKRTP